MFEEMNDWLEATCARWIRDDHLEGTDERHKLLYRCDENSIKEKAEHTQHQKQGDTDCKGAWHDTLE